jgi:hypothetical protein
VKGRTVGNQHEESPADERETEKSSGGRGKMLLAGLLGAVTGAVAGLLLAPWRGADARRKLKESAAAAKDKVGTAILYRRRGETAEEEGEEEDD